MRLTLDNMQRFAESRNLILEKEGKVYGITDNSQGVTEVCNTLDDVYAAIAHWPVPRLKNPLSFLDRKVIFIDHKGITRSGTVVSLVLWSNKFTNRDALSIKIDGAVSNFEYYGNHTYFSGAWGSVELHMGERDE